MTAPRIVPAAEARALLETATPGPWRMELHRERDAIHIDAPRGDARIGHDSWEGLAIVYGCEDNWIPGERAAYGNASLICAAHDLARTVVELHAEVERAAAAERARIVASLRARASSPEIDWRTYDYDDDEGPWPSSALRAAADDLEREEVTP